MVGAAGCAAAPPCRRAAGELVNDRDLDWSNIAEEIESIGRSERRACESHLVLTLLHDLKADAWLSAREVPHWRAEARLHRQEARRAFTPGMRQRIDLPRLYPEARAAMPETIDGQPPLPAPECCPVMLNILLGDGT